MTGELARLAQIVVPHRKRRLPWSRIPEIMSTALLRELLEGNGATMRHGHADSAQTAIQGHRRSSGPTWSSSTSLSRGNGFDVLEVTARQSIASEIALDDATCFRSQRIAKPRRHKHCYFLDRNTQIPRLLRLIRSLLPRASGNGASN